MEFKTCINGHRYDPSVTPQCPECAMMNGQTVSLFGPEIDIGGYGPIEEIGKTVPINSNTTPVNPQPSSWAPTTPNTPTGPKFVPEDYNRTMPLNLHADFAEKAMRPVAGWLVCIDGPEKGKDYRIHEENNYIGRSEKMDICIRSDDTVSRENHAIIAYDVRERTFFFAPCRGASIVRHNGRAVFNTAELKNGDRVEIGQGTFLFVPLCGEGFQW